MAGVGKTTISNALCRRFRQELGGKACHVELDIDGKNLVELIKELIQKLTLANPKLLRSTNDQACEVWLTPSFKGNFELHHKSLWFPSCLYVGVRVITHPNTIWSSCYLSF